jgi:drug/metabolite transporter (DMT)-like permease
MSADMVPAAEARREDKAATRGERRALLEVVIAMALAGSTVVAGKLLSARVPVFLSVELTLLAALAAVLPVQIARRRELALLGRRELGYMLLQAVFGIVLFRVLTLYGLRFTSALSAGIITSTAPALMAVLAAVFLRERPGRGAVAGIALAVAGVLLIALWGHEAAADTGSLTGNLLVLGATVCEALLTIFRKRSGGRVGSVTNTAVLVALSAVAMLPFAAADLRWYSLARVDAVAWAAILYYGAVATVLAYILWGRGALRIPAGRTGIATAALPLTALVLSVLVLGEPLRAVHLVGCAAVIAGVVVGRK